MGHRNERRNADLRRRRRHHHRASQIRTVDDNTGDTERRQRQDLTGGHLLNSGCLGHRVRGRTGHCLTSPAGHDDHRHHAGAAKPHQRFPKQTPGVSTKCSRLLTLTNVIDTTDPRVDRPRCRKVDSRRDHRVKSHVIDRLSVSRTSLRPGRRRRRVIRIGVLKVYPGHRRPCPDRPADSRPTTTGADTPHPKSRTLRRCPHHRHHRTVPDAPQTPQKSQLTARPSYRNSRRPIDRPHTPTTAPTNRNLRGPDCALHFCSQIVGSGRLTVGESRWALVRQ